jgi:phosphoglycerate dehydrogenase-like enzyme
MSPRTVCLIGPAHLFPAPAVAAFRAGHPELDVHWIDYAEPQPLRAARSQGRVAGGLTELIAQEPPIGEADRAALHRAVALVALDLPSDLPNLAPNVRFVQAVGAGIEWLVSHRLDRHGILLTRASGVASDSIAEFVLARLLQVWKDLRRLDAQQQERVWKPYWADEVSGRTLGVVGLGAIGRATAVRARAFGMRVLATRRSAAPGERDPDADELWPADRLDELLGACDAVLLSAPATPATADLFDAGRFAAMRAGSVFVNVSRGSLVDEDALVAALTSGHLGAAVLDVAKQEPAPPDHPFWTAPNLFLSPHCSASLDRYPDRLFGLFVDNLARHDRGEPLHNVVEAERGY